MAELNLGHVVGPGVPTGGTLGQILKKNSSTNFDTSWTNNDATTIPMSSSDATSINEAITNLGEVKEFSGTVASIESAMVTYFAGLDIGVPKNIKVTPSAASGILENTVYVGEMNKVNSSRFNVILEKSASGIVIVGNCNSGTFEWHQLALKESIDAYNLGEGTLSTIESALTTFCNGMANNEVRNIKFGITTASDPLAATTYLGTIVRNSSGRYVVNATGISAIGQCITGNYRNSAWGWEGISLKSDLSVKSSYTTTNNFINNSVTISLELNGTYLILVSASATQRCAAYIVYTDGSGNVYTNAILTGQYISVSTGTSSITITNSHTTGASRVTTIDLTRP